ncbi:uncharacterized protein PG998_003609 [Apiospora kogelbergensis]|uniref:uncharacterized protein n=1 Tax=Apiospora kogelbergensis TaxID=1337665 RepID=UPI00312FA654
MPSTSKLSVDPASANKKPKPKKAPVADSWEDESDSDDGEPSTTDTSATTKVPRSATGVAAPPPTPSTPTYNTGSAPWQPSAADNSYSSAGASSSEPRRPEKTDAVARRMIASALGVKAPRATEEQRAYDRALREKERKRRELEKQEEQRRAEQAEKAKAAIWED